MRKERDVSSEAEDHDDQKYNSAIKVLLDERVTNFLQAIQKLQDENCRTNMFVMW